MTLTETYPIRLVCRLLGVPRSSFYYTPRPALDEAMLKTALLDLQPNGRTVATDASPR